MIVREINRRGGETSVKVVDYKTGEVLADYDPKRERAAQARQLSMTNGFIGTEADLKRAKELDCKLGVPINYIPTHSSYNQQGEKTYAFRAEFENRTEKNRWLRKWGRFEKDACYSDPAPGWTRTAPEFREAYERAAREQER